MKNLSRTSWLTGAILAAGIAQSAGATTIGDQYVGADGGPYGDVVGSVNQFQITSMDVDQTGSTLDVDINTTFAGTAGTNFGAGTTTPDITYGDGIGYGDLFLSTDGWDPYGSSPYSLDNAGNGEVWEYALHIDGDRFASGDVNSGSITLYLLSGTNDDSALLSNDFIDAGTGSYRNGQEVAVDTDATYDDNGVTKNYATVVTDINGDAITGTWSVDDDANTISFNIDLSGTGLENTNLAFHWAMTCANDVIEGVPAPIILLLMATGLFGVGVSTAVRRKRA